MVVRHVWFPPSAELRALTLVLRRTTRAWKAPLTSLRRHESRQSLMAAGTFSSPKPMPEVLVDAVVRIGREAVARLHGDARCSERGAELCRREWALEFDEHDTPSRGLTYENRSPFACRNRSTISRLRLMMPKFRSNKTSRARRTIRAWISLARAPGTPSRNTLRP